MHRTVSITTAATVMCFASFAMAPDVVPEKKDLPKKRRLNPKPKSNQKLLVIVQKMKRTRKRLTWKTWKNMRGSHI